MSTSEIVVDREPVAEGGHVVHVTIDNRAKLNSLGRELMGRIVASIDRIAGDPGLRLVILTGAGDRAFCGGADIAELAALARDSAREFITLVHRTGAAVRGLPVPVIARIDGHALGAGLELAAACDLRVASERSQFGMPEVGVGIPSVVEAALLPRLVGAGRASRLLLTGESIDAAEALAWGLVDRVVPTAKLDGAVEALARPILVAGPGAIRLQKALIREWQELPLSAAISRGIERFVEAYAGDEPGRMAGAVLAEMQARRRARPR